MNTLDRWLVGDVSTKQTGPIGQKPYGFNDICLVGAPKTNQNQATKLPGSLLSSLLSFCLYIREAKLTN